MNIKKVIITHVLIALLTSYIVGQETIVSKINESLIAVEGGSFNMGSSLYEKNERPVRNINIKGFYMLKTEVTQEQYMSVMGVNYSHFKSPNRPVEEVSWYDAIVFCNRLSILAGLTPAYSLDGQTNPELWGDVPRITDGEDLKAHWNTIVCDFSVDGYRLPTEAEWEYAAHGGVFNETTLYSGSDNLSEVGWNVDSLEGETRDVAMLLPNALGLYDMSGNVWEWCWDWYGTYKVSDIDNPIGADMNITGKKIRRGGSISSDKVFCRVSNRASSNPEIRGVDLGFRIVRSLPVIMKREEDFPLSD